MDLNISKGKKTWRISMKKDATLSDLKLEFEKETNISIHRQCFKQITKDSRPQILSKNDTPLSQMGVSDGSELLFKDFGPQIGYRTVFLIEYLGPLVFMLGYATRPTFVYGPDASKDPLDLAALVGVIAWSLHFLKREFETVWVHRFSRATMPLLNLFKNSIYYWTFGLMVGYPLCHPDYTPPESTLIRMAGLMLFCVSECLNFAVHVQLRNLRPNGSLRRPVPTGWLFEYVACPNYTYEVLGWVGFSCMTNVGAAYLFTLIGFLQMTDWALKKHRGYLKTYGDDYKRLRRKAIVPFLV